MSSDSGAAKADGTPSIEAITTPNTLTPTKSPSGAPSKRFENLKQSIELAVLLSLPFICYCLWFILCRRYSRKKKALSYKVSSSKTSNIIAGTEAHICGSGQSSSSYYLNPFTKQRTLRSEKESFLKEGEPPV